MVVGGTIIWWVEVMKEEKLMSLNDSKSRDNYLINHKKMNN